jgi:hypothetical protein
MKVIFSIILWLMVTITISQNITTPLEFNNFSRPTSYEELSRYVKLLDSISPELEVATIGKSVQGRNLYALKFSTSEFGKDTSKIKVLIFAQQHGNEQSGKEGALLLAKELLKSENHYLLDRIDLALIPQVNPDGAEANKRRNGNTTDLNRSHLTLFEPELIALHHFFDTYWFEVNMDVHEYSPFGETYKEFGYRNNSRELIGCNTNINISEAIRNLSNQGFVPYFNQYLNERNISNSIYAPGGPPEIDYIRHSTYDINDGRQSFGIQNSFSFILEGLNGPDNYKDSIQMRAEGQKTGMMALITYCYQNKESIKTVVAKERTQLITQEPGSLVSIQMEHVKDGRKLNLPVYSYATGTDSIIIVHDYRPVVKSIHDVTKPIGYLIPKQLNEVVDWGTRHSLKTEPFSVSKSAIIEEYTVTTIDSMDFERDTIVNPNLTVRTLSKNELKGDYLFIPTNQLKGNMLVIALEPKSELGLVTYKSFSHLLKAGQKYPILRVVKN